MGVVMKIWYLFVCLIITACAPVDLYDHRPGSYSYVIGNPDGTIQESLHPDAVVTPASCQKTITALLALASLGPDFAYETTLGMTGDLSAPRDVVLHFSGDPTLTSDDVRTLFAPLKNKGIRGRIILDATAYQVSPHSKNLTRDDVGTADAPPVSAMILDDNLIYITEVPGENGTVIQTTNDLGYPMDVTITQDKEVTQRAYVWRGQVIEGRGTLGDADPEPLMISPTDIQGYMLRKIKKIMKELNVHGQVIIVTDPKKLPRGMKILKTHTSEPLRDLIVVPMKKSHNLPFDSLYITLLNVHSVEPVTNWDDGDKIFKDLLKKHYGIAMDSSRFVDGSGISRYNGVHVGSFFTLLEKGSKNPDMIRALPMPGESKTTLKNRRDLPATFRAKTGSLSGVRCLCGYAITPGNSRTFVMMVNNFAPPATEIMKVMDRVLADKVS